MLIVVDRIGVPHIQSFSHGFSTETLQEIAAILHRFGVQRVVIESNFGGGMWSSLLLPHLLNPVEIKEITASGQKELRILDCLQPVTENHRIVIDPSVARNEEFGFQFSRLSRDRGSLKHDDIIDSLSIAVGNLKEFVGVDPQSVANRRAKREQEKEIKDFLDAYRKQHIPIGREDRKGFTSINRERGRGGRSFLSQRQR